jgi:DamX protein
MSDDIVENYAEIQKLASRKLESNADSNHMENLADLFADKVETDFFATSNLYAQLDEVIHLCQFGGNVVSLLGNKGVGKSAFLAEVRRELAETSYCCMIDSALMMTAEDVFRQIISQLELPVAPSSNTGEMLVGLRKSMSDSSLNRVVIIIDDADFLNEPILSALISLFQAAHGGQFHLLLSGDKTLIERLDALEIVDVLIYDIHLNPFSLEEVKDYVDFKLGLVGKNVEDYFKQGEIDSIYKESKGFPFIINKAVQKHLYRIENVDELGPLDDERKSGLPLLHMGLLIVLLAGLIMTLIYMGDDGLADNKLETTTILQQPILIEAKPDAIDEAINKLNAERNVDSTQQAPSNTSNAAIVERNVATPTQVPVIETTVAQSALAKVNAIDPAILANTQPNAGVTPEAQVIEPSDVNQVLASDLKKELEREAELLTLNERSASASAQPSANNNGALSANEQAVMQWADTSFTLQLIGAGQKASLVKFIAAQPNASSLLLVSLTRNSKPWYVVVTGVYENTELARQAIQSLPQNQVNDGPWPKKVSDLKQDMQSFRRN